jgi:hypothetical protein
MQKHSGENEDGKSRIAIPRWETYTEVTNHSEYGKFTMRNHTLYEVLRMESFSTMYGVLYMNQGQNAPTITVIIADRPFLVGLQRS